jgi:hypothetical protein
MKQVEAPGSQSTIDRTKAKARSSQLLPCDYPVLALCQVGAQRIWATSPQKASHIDAFCGLVRHGAIVAPTAARVVRPMWRFC